MAGIVSLDEGLKSGPEKSIHTEPPPTLLFAAAEHPSKAPINIKDLPNELLSTIFGYLDNEPPSASQLLDEPTIDLTTSDIIDLKAGSLVSKRWRQAILPILHKHTRFIFPVLSFKRIDLRSEIIPFLNFVIRNSLQKVVSSLIILVRDRDLPCHLDWIFREDGCTTFWQSIFAAINPTDLIIVAPPLALGGFTSCRISSRDFSDFDNTLHYLRLQRNPASSDHEGMTATEENSKPIEMFHESPEYHSDMATENGFLTSQLSSQSDYLSLEEPPRATTSLLFDIRSWSTILLNEGSFIKAYSSNEFWLKKAPSILPALLGEKKDFADFAVLPLISPTIREMSYISIFPMQSHFGTISDTLPRLDRIYVQLVPRNNILDDEVRMSGVDSEDLWMERNASYALLMRELFTYPPVGNYRYLKSFESGDAADRDAWDMAVEYVKRAGNGWKIAGDGLFVKDLSDITVTTGATEEEGSALLVN